MERPKCGERKDPEHTSSSIKHDGCGVMTVSISVSLIFRRLQKRVVFQILQEHNGSQHRSLDASFPHFLFCSVSLDNKKGDACRSQARCACCKHRVTVTWFMKKVLQLKLIHTFRCKEIKSESETLSCFMSIY